MLLNVKAGQRLSKAGVDGAGGAALIKMWVGIERAILLSVLDLKCLLSGVRKRDRGKNYSNKQCKTKIIYVKVLKY